MEDKNIPKVSIGLPVYNGETYLKSALNDLLAQDFDDYEIIISDNASTDGTAEICEEYARRNPRIRYYRQSENKGAGWNFKHVLDLARGEYFAWAAHDDAWQPSCFRRCLMMLDENPQAIMVHPQVGRIDGDGRMRGEIYVNYVADSSSARSRLRKVLSDWQWTIASFYGVYRTAELRGVKTDHSVYGADHVILVEVALHGQMLEVPEILFTHRTLDWERVASKYIERVMDSLKPQKTKKKHRFVQEKLVLVFLATVWRPEKFSVIEKMLFSFDVLSIYGLNVVVINRLKNLVGPVIEHKRLNKLTGKAKSMGWYRKFRNAK